MATTQIPNPTPDSEPVSVEQLLKNTIDEAREARRPISRQQLAALVHEKTGQPTKIAYAVVEEYCDEKAPGVPEYLQKEFAAPYLKVVAVAFVLGGLFVFWTAVRARMGGRMDWPLFAGGVVTFGIGVLMWVKSLETKVD